MREQNDVTFVEANGLLADDRGPAGTARDAMELHQVVDAGHDRGNELARVRILHDPWTSRFKAGDFDVWSERSEAAVDVSDNSDLRDLLDEELRHLSPEHRAVIELTYFHECSYQEIALIADCPVNTVKTRMFHARAKLRTLLPALGSDELCA